MQMTRNEIADKLKDVFKMAAGSAYDEAKCTENANLTTDLGLSSVGMLYIVIAIEEFFGIQFDDVGFGDFVLVKDVIDYIEKKLAQ